MKKLKLNSDTVRTLTGAELTLAAAGVDIYTGGDETVGHPGCDSVVCPGSDPRVCSVGCSGTVPRCPPWPDPG